MTTELVVYWEELLDETGAVVLDESGDAVLVPMLNGLASVLVEAAPDPIVTAGNEEGLTTVTWWEGLLDETGAAVLDETGDPVLVPTDVSAPLVDACGDLVMNAAFGTEPGIDVGVVMWQYLITEAGEYVLTEAGEYLLIPVDDEYEAIMVDALPDSLIVVARED